MTGAVFIEPAGGLLRFITEWKRRIRRQRGLQPYGAHPPHATVLVGPVADAERWTAALEERLAGLAPFPLRTLGPIAFHDDPSTGGGQTLALEAEGSDGIRALQAAAAEAARPFVDRKAIPAPADFLAKEPFRTSFRTWGYPFVGPHWRPHFTAASVAGPRADPLVVRFLEESGRYRMTVRSVGLWVVEGEAHRRLAVVRLKGRA